MGNGLREFLNVGATCGRPPEGFSDDPGMAGERSSPLRDENRWCDMGNGLWAFLNVGATCGRPPEGFSDDLGLAGERSSPLQEGCDLWAVGATCGRPRACKARPYGMKIDGATWETACGRF